MAEPGQIPYVDAQAPQSRVNRALGRLAASALSTTLSQTRFWRRYVLPADAGLVRRTNGRMSLIGGPIRAGLLGTRGARTHAARQAPVISLRDCEDIILVTSNAGRPAAPAWFHNLRVTPAVSFNAISIMRLVAH